VQKIFLKKNNKGRWAEWFTFFCVCGILGISEMIGEEYVQY
jgi:hypothetical protein